MSDKASRGQQSALEFETTSRLEYLLYLPKEYGNAPEEKWPLILFLHGIGQRGDDLELIKKHGIPKIVEEQQGFPFVAVSPQCPDGTMWWDHRLTLKELLDTIIDQHAIDPNRVYLTGLSMGGYGTWHLASGYPDQFAAIVPICGGGMPRWAGALKNVPVWAFHGDKDEAVPLEQGQQMVDALRASGGNVRFTVYPGVGHDSWTVTYENPELYEWLLKHTR